MNKRKLATLVAASFASLMLSSPSFAANADKDKSQAAPAAAAQESQQTGSTTPPKLGAPESRSAERADKQAAVSKEDAAAAKADYKAAIQKCDALPSGERSSCVQDAKDAQSLVMNGSPAKRGAPESRIVGPQSAK